MISESSHRDLRDDWAHIALPSKTRNRSWPLVSREGEGGRGMLGGDTKRGQAVVSPVSCMYDKCMDVCIHVSMYRGAVPRIPQTQDFYRLWRLVGLAGTKYAFPLAKLWRHRVLLIPLRYARSKSGRLIYHIRVKYFHSRRSSLPYHDGRSDSSQCMVHIESASFFVSSTPMQDTAHVLIVHSIAHAFQCEQHTILWKSNRY